MASVYVVAGIVAIGLPGPPSRLRKGIRRPTRLQRPLLRRNRLRLLVVARQDGLREPGSKACYQLCPRGSASVRAGSRISVGDRQILAGPTMSL